MSYILSWVAVLDLLIIFWDDMEKELGFDSIIFYSCSLTIILVVYLFDLLMLKLVWRLLVYDLTQVRWVEEG